MGILSFFNKSKTKQLEAHDLGWGNHSGGLLPYVSSNEKFKDSMQETSAFVCIMMLAQDISKLPLNIYKINEENGRVLAFDHPLFKAFKNGPNDYQTGVEFIEFLIWDFYKRGNFYSFIGRDSKGEVSNLYPIEANRVSVYETIEGDIYYGISPSSGIDNHILDNFKNYIDKKTNDFLIPARYIWHGKDIPTGNGVVGMSRIQAQAETINLALKQREFSGTMLDNRSVPALTLTTDKKLSKEASERLKEAWDTKYRGASKAFKTAVLQDGLKLDTIKVDYGDLALLDHKKVSHYDIARIFRVPPTKLMDRDGSSYNNVEGENQNYVTDSLLPVMEKIESSIGKYLLDDPRYIAEFDVSRLLRGDSKARAEYYKTTRQWGITTINEARKMEGLNKVQGGDAVHMPMNMEDINNPKNIKSKKVSDDK